MSPAEAISELTRLLSAGLTLREALARWAAHVPGRSDVERVGQAIRLGATPATALSAVRASFGTDGAALSRMVGLHAQLGGDLVVMLERLAEMSAAREAARKDAEMHVSGIRLSARMVAALPLFFIPLLPTSRAPIADEPGLALLAVGGALSFVGMRWIDRLLPRPPREADRFQVFLVLVAAIVSGGCGLHQTLMGCSRDVGGESGRALTRARRQVMLGLTWAEAFKRSDDERVRRLGGVLGTATELGLAPAEVLMGAARADAAGSKRSFEAAIRRAPVKMIVPLTTCVLPAFAIIGAGPFLRSVLS